MNLFHKALLASLLASISLPSFAEEEAAGEPSDGIKVKITRQIANVQVEHAGKPVTIERNQNTSNKIHDKFQLTSRPCPPFCIQPMTVADGVETINEISMLKYLERVSQGDDSVLVIDSRGAKWLERGTIPGSVNIHYKKLSLGASSEESVAEILEEQFGAERTSEFWNFSNAKTLVLFCNGLWCGQAPTNIKSLLRIGYPANKLKWYRGGMQAWESVGLTSVKP